jgi:hypothetical protein
VEFAPVAANVGAERLKVSKSPPVPNPDSGPTVCIVLSVRVLLPVLLAVVADDELGCFMAAVIALMEAVSEDPD